MKTKHKKRGFSRADGDDAGADLLTNTPEVDLPSVSVGKKSGLLGDMDINAKIDLPRNTILTIAGAVIFCAIFIFTLIVTRDVLKKKVLH